jgi:hypothetical protein
VSSGHKPEVLENALVERAVVWPDRPCCDCLRLMVGPWNGLEYATERCGHVAARCGARPRPGRESVDVTVSIQFLFVQNYSGSFFKKININVNDK